MARFRPQNSIEIREGGQPIVQFHSEDTCELTVGPYLSLSESNSPSTDHVAVNRARKQVAHSPLIGCLI